MNERTLPHTHRAKETWERSFLKANSFMLFVLVLDIGTLYWFSDQFKAVIGFLLLANLYLGVSYFLQERLWNDVAWGRSMYKKNDEDEPETLVHAHEFADEQEPA